MPATAASDLILVIARLAADVGPLLAPATGAVLAFREHRVRRWRYSLNACLHELRRPLQVLALESAGSGPGALELARAALADLDTRLNESGGSRGGTPARSVTLAGSIDSSLERWRTAFDEAGRSILATRPPSDGPAVAIDPTSLARILDNLIANALDHGTGEVLIDHAIQPDRSHAISITDAGAAAGTGKAAGPATDPRHGHGLVIARELANRSGGRLELEIGERCSRQSVIFPPVGAPR